MILFQQPMANRLDLMKLFGEMVNHLRSSRGDHRIKVISDNSTLDSDFELYADCRFEKKQKEHNTRVQIKIKDPIIDRRLIFDPNYGSHAKIKEFTFRFC